MHDVFVIYSSKDKVVADTVCAKLELEKISCWIAPRDILPGSDYGKSIIDAINQSSLMVLIHSSNSFHSKYVTDEIFFAFENEKPILIFRIEDVPFNSDFNFAIGQKNWIDALNPPLETHTKKLVEIIRNTLNLEEYKTQPQDNITPIGLNDEEIEIMAKMEHKKWMEERLTEGWKLDTTIKEPDHYRKLSPYLIPWDELPIKIKEFTIRNILEIIHKSLDKNHPDTQSLNNLALLYQDMGRYDKAATLLKEATDLSGKIFGVDHPDYALILNNLASIYKDMGRFNDALPLFQESIKIYYNVLGRNDPNYVASLNNLALLYQDMGMYDEALLLYTEVKEIIAKREDEEISSLEDDLKLDDDDLKYFIKNKVLNLDNDSIKQSQNVKYDNLEETKESEIKINESPVILPMATHGFFIDSEKEKNEDDVHFTIISPSIVPLKKWFTIELWAHLEENYEDIIELAKNNMGKSKRTEIMRKTKGPFEVSLKTHLNIVLDIKNAIIEDNEDMILWNGQRGNADFRVKITEKNAENKIPGKITIYANDLQIARLYFEIRIGEEFSENEKLPLRQELPKKAFVSYSSEDRKEVFARIHGMEKVVPNLEIFMDVTTLRSGDDWKERLKEEICSCDVFFLFWSENAKNSEWVKKEWKCALKTRGIDIINPVPLVCPKKAPVPPELSNKHFNDRFFAFGDDC